MAGLFGMSEKREALACVGGPDCVGWKARTLAGLFGVCVLCSSLSLCGLEGEDLDPACVDGHA